VLDQRSHPAISLRTTDASQQPRVPGTGAGYGETTCKAARNLDETIGTLVRNFGEGSDYFKVLVNVFQSVLLTAEHDHLKNFYMIGECPLCRFVCADHMRVEKNFVGHTWREQALGSLQ
jgi:hypothetical protein